MSGGSLDYVYVKVEDAANDVASRAETPEHRAFAAHLQKVAKALKALEWMWSCDTSRGSEREAVMACIAPSDVLAEAVRNAERAKAELEAVLRDVNTVRDAPK